MGYQQVVISFVESLFPTGTKRREMINIVGRPIAIKLGFPVPQPETIPAARDDFMKLIRKSDKIKELSDTAYWDSIVNFIRLKYETFMENPASTLEMPRFDEPEATILLVTFNKAEYTYQCLETIKAHADVPYEVVVVDNASSDRTVEMLGKVKNIRVIENTENLGFLLACNQGAKLARGEFVLFLNNDTQTTPGLLSRLVTTMRDYPQCGAAGGKIILPDGKLQEAGCLILNDGSAYQYGRFNNPSSPEFNYVKEVDYASGACLMVRKDLLEKVGCFDETFAPAYYEEVDLCFELRKLGYRVVYQPEAVLIHYEFGSGSLKKASEMVLANKGKFVEKWKTELKGRPATLDGNTLKMRDTRQGTRVLVIEDRVPAPYLGSGYPRSYQMLLYLAELGYIVTLLPLQSPEKIPLYTNILQQKGIEVLYGDRKVDFRAFMEKRADYYDIALVSRPHNAEETLSVIKTLSPRSKVIYDAEAVFALREILQLRLKGREMTPEKESAMIGKETGVMKYADSIVTVSELEKETIERYTDCGVSVWGYPVETSRSRAGFGERKDILFVGSFLTPDSPNEDAAIHFVKDIFPDIEKALGCRLWIVGNNWLESIKGLDGPSVRVTGKVEDLGEYFEKCRVFVVPHRFAAGIPLKLLEAMSHGLPSVVSPLMAKQLGFDDGTRVLVGDSPESFAKSVVRVYNDEKLWEKMREESLRYIGDRCSPDAMKRSLDDIIRVVCPGGAAGKAGRRAKAAAGS